MRGSRLGNRRLFSNDIEKRPRQIFACAQVRKDALNRSRKAQGARAQEEDWVASNARSATSASGARRRRTLRAGIAARPTASEAGCGTVDQRMKAFLLQLFAHRPIARPSTSLIDWNSAEYSSTGWSASESVNSGTDASNCSCRRCRRMDGKSHRPHGASSRCRLRGQAPRVRPRDRCDRTAHTVTRRFSSLRERAFPFLPIHRGEVSNAQGWRS